MEKNDFEFDVESNIKEAEDAYDYSDLEDLSLIEPKRKRTVVENDEDEEEDELEKKATKALKILGIVTLAIIVITAIVVIVMVATSKLSKNTYKYNYELGVEYYTNENYEEAITAFEKALTYDDASNVNERLFLYKCYKTLGNEEEAIAVLEELLTYDEFNKDAITVIAQYYANNGKMSDLTAMVEKYKGTEAESVLAAYSVAIPAVSLDSGKYDTALNIVLASNNGDSIYYTIDGSVPTTGSQLYVEPIVIGKGTTVLKAIAVNNLGLSSAVIERQYEIEYVIPGAPEVSPASGSYTEDQQITLSNIPEGVTAYYTFDGTIPTVESEKYTAPIDMPGGNNIFTVLYINADNVAGDVVKRNYNLKISEKYSFDASIEAIKYVLIKKEVIASDGNTTVDGEDIKFVYYGKREVNKKEMYIMYYDIKINGSYVRQEYMFGVDINTGATYKVTDVNGVLTSEEYK